jgi:hypothetical protein
VGLLNEQDGCGHAEVSEQQMHLLSVKYHHYIAAIPVESSQWDGNSIACHHHSQFLTRPSAVGRHSLVAVASEQQSASLTQVSLFGSWALVQTAAEAIGMMSELPPGTNLPCNSCLSRR